MPHDQAVSSQGPQSLVSNRKHQRRQSSARPEIAWRLNDGPLPEAMALPGYRFHPLKGDRHGTWAVWVSGYRLTFEIDGEDAANVDFEDYH